MSLLMADCFLDPSVKLLKFADDTTVIGLIQNGDESAYRREEDQQVLCCSQNNLELNTLKTVEIMVDFRNAPLLAPSPHSPQQPCVDREELQIPGHNHLSGSEVGAEYQLHPPEGPAPDVLPAALEETWSGPGAAVAVLHCSQQVCPVLHHCVVQNCHQAGQYQTETHYEDCGVHHRCPPPALYKTCTPPGLKRGQGTS